MEGPRRLLAPSLALGATGTWAVASHLLPPGPPPGVWAVLGVLTGTLALAAVLHRWVLPGTLSQLATSSRGARIAWLLGCTAIAWLLLRAVPVNAPRPHAFGTLTLTATGARNPQALGSELWSFGLRRPDGGTLPQDAWERTGAWELRDGVWLSYLEQPATLRWQGWAPRPLQLELLSHPHSGIVRYEWNGQSREVDLYSPETKRLQLELPLSSATTLGQRVQRALFHVTHVGALAALLLAAGLWLSRRPGPRPLGERPTFREGLLYALPSLLTGGVWWLAVFPGLMSSDSTDQWNQANTGRMHDAHPVFNTFLIRVLIQLWPTPGIVSAAQLLTFAALVGWGCFSLRQAGLSRPVVWLTALGLGLAPVNGTLVNTIWKDVPFSLGVLALSILLFRRVHLRHEPPRWRFWVGLAVAAILTILLRHNGPPAAMATFLGVLLLEPRRWKAVALCMVVTFGLSTGIRSSIIRAYDAGVADSGVALIGYLGGHVAAGTPLSEDERTVLSDIHPLDDRWNYYCVSNVPTVFDGRFSHEAVRQHGARLPALLVELTLRDYRPTLNHFACATTLLWRLSQGSKGHNNGPPVAELPSGELGTIYESPISPQPAPVLPELGQWLLSMVMRTLQPDLSWLFWRPALPLYLVLLACAIACLRRRSWHPAVGLLPILVHTLVLALVIPSPDIRYQYPVFLVSQLFTLGWLLIPRLEEGTAPGRS